jgi:hypothetical protein
VAILVGLVQIAPIIKEDVIQPLALFGFGRNLNSEPSSGLEGSVLLADKLRHDLLWTKEHDNWISALGLISFWTLAGGGANDKFWILYNYTVNTAGGRHLV